MTRQQFIEEVTDWSNLLDWCFENGCSYCDDIFSDEARDDYINSNLGDWIRDYDWYELRDILGNILTGHNYWLRDDWGDWLGVDDKFDSYFNDVLNWADENNIFETEEELISEDLTSSLYEDESDEFEIDTTVSLDTFFVSNAEDFNKITAEAKAEAEAEVKAIENKINEDFNRFVQGVTTVGDY